MVTAAQCQSHKELRDQQGEKSGLLEQWGPRVETHLPLLDHMAHHFPGTGLRSPCRLVAQSPAYCSNTMQPESQSCRQACEGSEALTHPQRVCPIAPGTVPPWEKSLAPWPMLISLKFPAGVCSLDCVIRIQRVTVLPGHSRHWPGSSLPGANHRPGQEACPLSWRPPLPALCPIPTPRPASTCLALPTQKVTERKWRNRPLSGCRREKGQDWCPRVGLEKSVSGEGSLAPLLCHPQSQK